MPLPQQVVNQLSSEPAETPGWSLGILFFSGAVLVVTIGIYFGMTLVYEPYLNSQITKLQTQAANISQSIPSSNQSQLLTFYSQISNLQSLLGLHVLFSQFLSWLEHNTESNVSYTQMSFASASGYEITLTGNATNEADINQQLAIFEASPQVENVSISNLGTVGATGAWQFSLSLIMNPNLFVASST